jgi:hypothetical protein
LKILFDQNVPRALGKHLGSHQVIRSAERNWQQLKNGDLLLAAEEEAFDLLLTCDQNLEYQQKVTGRRIAVLALSTNNWPLLRTRVEDIVNAIDRAKSGTYRWRNCGAFRRQRRPPARED